MKKLMLLIIFTSLFLTFAKASTSDLLYDGKEIYVKVKRDHVTTVIFPESINSVVRGFGAESYVIRRNEKKNNIVEFMPTDLEAAEMTIGGISGEEYVLRFMANEDFFSKLVIRRMAKNNEKNEEKIIPSPVDTIPEPKSQGQASDLPPELLTKITLKGNDLPLKIYLSTIAQVTGLNVITTPSIEEQKTSINLENIEVWRALKSLLYKFGFGFKISQQDLIITETETRIFNILMPAVDQNFTDETSNASYADNTSDSNTSSSNQQNQNIRVGTKIYYANSSPKLSLWTDLESNVKSMITPNIGSYSINKVSGSVIVTDKPQILDKIEDVISTINESLSLQQSFEIQIIEVTLSSDFESGIDWNAIAKGIKGINNITASTNFSAQGFLSGQLFSLSAAGPSTTSGINNSGVSMLLKALDSMGSVNVVSRPSITVSNMFPSIIQEVTSIPYISGTGQTIGNNVTQSNVTTSQVSDGLTMRLQAKINEHKTVLNISAALNTLDSMTTIPVGNGLSIQEPQVSTKSITTNVTVEPMKTLILGGLISTTKNDTTQGIPYMDKIPFLGNAFQYKAKSSQKTELVIIITPKGVTKNI